MLGLAGHKRRFPTGGPSQAKTGSGWGRWRLIEPSKLAGMKANGLLPDEVGNRCSDSCFAAGACADSSMELVPPVWLMDLALAAN